MQLAGELSKISLPSLIQLVRNGGLTGEITISQGANTATIFVEKGRIVHVESDVGTGKDAFLELFLWLAGTFSFIEQKLGDIPRTFPTDEPMDRLLREGVAYLEQKKYLDQLRINGQTILKPTPVARGTRALPLLDRLDGRKTLAQALSDANLSRREYIRAVHKLLSDGLAVVVEPISQGDQVDLPGWVVARLKQDNPELSQAIVDMVVWVDRVKCWLYQTDADMARIIEDLGANLEEPAVADVATEEQELVSASRASAEPARQPPISKMLVEAAAGLEAGEPAVAEPSARTPGPVRSGSPAPAGRPAELPKPPAPARSERVRPGSLPSRATQAQAASAASVGSEPPVAGEIPVSANQAADVAAASGGAATRPGSLPRKAARPAGPAAPAAEAAASQPAAVSEELSPAPAPQSAPARASIELFDDSTEVAAQAAPEELQAGQVTPTTLPAPSPMPAQGATGAVLPGRPYATTSEQGWITPGRPQVSQAAGEMPAPETPAASPPAAFTPAEVVVQEAEWPGASQAPRAARPSSAEGWVTPGRPAAATASGGAAEAAATASAASQVPAAPRPGRTYPHLQAGRGGKSSLPGAVDESKLTADKTGSSEPPAAQEPPAPPEQPVPSEEQPANAGTPAQAEQEAPVEPAQTDNVPLPSPQATPFESRLAKKIDWSRSALLRKTPTNKPNIPPSTPPPSIEF